MCAMAIAPAASASIGSLVTFVATLFYHQQSDAPTERFPYEIVTPGGVFSEWESEHVDISTLDLEEARKIQDDECQAFDGRIQYSNGVCSHFALGRLLTTSLHELAVRRALSCSKRWKESDCILSGEVGLSIPAAFVYSADSGMRMITAPRVLHEEAVHETDKDNETYVRVTHRATVNRSAGSYVVRMNRSVMVEYTPGASKRAQREWMHASDAFCVQLLRTAFTNDCWNNLD